MDVPTGGIFGLLRVLFRPIIEFFEMLLFYRAYEISTLYHSHREAFGVRPDTLSEGIEYKILWKPYHLRKKLITPMIWLRAADKNFSKVVLTVTGSNDKIKYQDNLTLFELDDIPIQSSLPSIPFRDLTFRDNMVYTPYDHIKIEVKELYDSNGDKIDWICPKNGYMRPCDRLEVAMGEQKGDVEKWGEIFNFEFIEMEIREQKIKLIGSRFRTLKPLYFLKSKIFSISLVVKFIFWSKNLIFAKQLTSEFIQYLEDHEEHKKWLEESDKSEAA